MYTHTMHVCIYIYIYMLLYVYMYRYRYRYRYMYAYAYVYAYDAAPGETYQTGYAGQLHDVHRSLHASFDTCIDR